MTEQRPIIDVLSELLTIEARLEGLGRRGAVLRAELDQRAAAQLKADGVAPTYRAKGLGLASYSDPQPRIVVKDADAFAGWVAQRMPQQAVAALTIPADPDTLERALAALDENDVAVTRTTVIVDPAFAKAFAEGCAAVDEAPTDEVFASPAAGDAYAGQRVDGLYLAPAAPGRISVRLDKEAKERAIAELADPLAAGILVRPIGELTAPRTISTGSRIADAILDEFDAPRDVHGDRLDVDDDAEGEPDDDDWHPAPTPAGALDDTVTPPTNARTEAEAFELPAGQTLDDLKALQLQDLCTARTLARSGAKPALIARLRASEQVTA